MRMMEVIREEGGEGGRDELGESGRRLGKR